MTETNRIELKQQLTDSLEKEVIAFLNYKEGGAIYIGIDKQGVAIGVPDSDGDQLKIKDRLKNNIAPSCMGLFDVVSEKSNGLDIIKIVVASGSEKPYFIKKFGMTEKGSFMRIGTAAEPMPQKLIDELFAKRTRNSISKIKSNQQALTFEQLKIYYEATGTKLNDKFATNLELLNGDNEFNYVAYLLSDKNNTSIKLAKYKGTTRVDLIENNEYGYGSLIKATKQILDKMELENKTITKITSKERQETRLWDEIALREAIINAFVHNDYTNEIPPKFEIFDDRIEITSAGGLPESLSQEEFFEGFSVPRNKEIMRVFKDLDLVEQLGSGIPRILESYSKECFKFSDNFLRMTFPVEQVGNQIDEKDVDTPGGQIGSQIGGQINDKTGGSISTPIGSPISTPISTPIKDLTNRQKEVLNIIVNDEKISRRDIAEQLKINESAVKKHLEILKDKGYIERIGGTRGYWKVKNT